MKSFKKVLAAIAAAAIAVTAFVIPASASIEDTAKKANIDDAYSVEFSNNSEEVTYKVQIKSKGTFSVKVNSTTKYSQTYLYDSDGSNVGLLSTYVKTGSDYGSNKAGDIGATYEWNSGSGKLVATTNWQVEKGTYYIKVTNDNGWSGFYHDYSAGKTTVTMDFEEDDAPVLSYLSVSLKKGTSLTLGGVFTTGKGTVTWESSKEKVATVSSKGVVKAIKKGTALITAAYEDTELIIKVIVS